MIPVIIYDKCQCDPKKCTAKRMLKFGLGREAKTLGAIPSGSIVLSPFSDRALSPADIGHAHKGLVVMDLTWTNIDEFPRLKRVEERALPYLLASNPGRVFSTDEIFEKVWNEKVYEANNTVMVHIRRLRGKMKEDTRQNKIITTVWGVGYKIEK